MKKLYLNQGSQNQKLLGLKKPELAKIYIPKASLSDTKFAKNIFQ
jgi:hypothetical protein